MIRNFSNEKIVIDKTKKSIFLAGPTRRNSTFDKSWRLDACNILEQNGFDGIVYIPEFSTSTNFDYNTQTEWERAGLKNASIILFYIPRQFPDMPALTTNVEFGMWLSKRPEATMLCSPLTAERNRYLEWLFLKEKPDGKIYTELENVLKDICI